jgi:hypothetical protein
MLRVNPLASRAPCHFDSAAEDSVFCRGLFFFDVFVDQARYAATAEAAGRLMFGFAFGIAHEAPIEGFFSADKVIVVKSQFAAFAAL